MLITKEIEIDMAHRVPNHKSKCRNLHGHRYKIEVGVDDKVITTKGTSDEGMVIDFGDLKTILMEELDERFDHNGIFYEGDKDSDILLQLSLNQDKDIYFVPFIPTAENLAQFWFELIKPRLEEKGIKIKHLKIWETPTSTAIYQLNN